MSSLSWLRLTAYSATILAMVATGGTLSVAEPVSDQILSGVRVAEKNGCAVVKIDFHSRVQYLSHFPLNKSDELKILLNPIDKGLAARSVVVNHKSLRAPVNERASIHAIELGLDAEGASLMIYFRRLTAYKIAPSKDFKSLIIATAGRRPSPDCEPVFDEAAIAEGNGLRGTLSARDVARVSELRFDPEELDGLMAEAREALSKKQYDRAIRLLTRISRSNDDRYAQETKELMGVARENNGQIAHAKAEYGEYLKLYPKGPGAKRVKSRVDALVAAEKLAFDDFLRRKELEDKKTPRSARIDDWKGDKKLQIRSSGPQPGYASNWQPIDEKKDPDAWTVVQSGSVSLYYNRNQGGRDYFVAPQFQQGWEKENIYQVYQNSVIGSLDYRAQFSNASFEGGVRVSTAHDQRLLEDRPNETSVSSLYVEGRWKDSGVSARVGRQSRYAGGVLGRFDGALLGYEVSKRIKINVAGGAPVERSRDTPFLRGSYFGSVGADVEINKDLNAGVYVAEQWTDDLVDRQAVGAEMRYVSKTASAFGVVDYDVHYQELNNAILTGTYIFADKSTLGFNFDYRRSPLIFTTNAMQGQTASSLKELLGLYTRDEVERFAIDRTAQSYTGSVNYSYPFNEHLQFNGDATLTYMSGTHESGGVAASPATGLEFYSLASLTASSYFVDGDVYTAGVRFADTQQSYRYMIEANTRYPLTENWRISPIMRVGFVDYKDDERTEIQLMPTLRASYYLTRDITFDFEVGRKWIERETLRGTENETELLLLAGVRYDFRIDK